MPTPEFSGRLCWRGRPRALPACFRVLFEGGCATATQRIMPCSETIGTLNSGMVTVGRSVGCEGYCSVRFTKDRVNWSEGDCDGVDWRFAGTGTCQQPIEPKLVDARFAGAGTCSPSRPELVDATRAQVNSRARMVTSNPVSEHVSEHVSEPVSRHVSATPRGIDGNLGSVARGA